jgi:hypothetical protein
LNPGLLVPEADAMSLRQAARAILGNILQNSSGHPDGIRLEAPLPRAFMLFGAIRFAFQCDKKIDSRSLQFHPEDPVVRSCIYMYIAMLPFFMTECAFAMCVQKLKRRCCICK